MSDDGRQDARDPEEERRDPGEAAGGAQQRLPLEQIQIFDERRLALAPWLERVDVPDADRDRVRELLGDATDGETVRMPLIVLQARKSQS